MIPIKVSIILTSYNRTDSIERAFRSILNQTYSNWELFIVDDNSNTETQSKITELVKSDPRCTLIQSDIAEKDRHKTARYASCINLAIPKSKGDLITYLTDDDLFFPRRLEIMVKYFIENPEVHIVYGEQLNLFYENGKITHHTIRKSIGITRSAYGNIDHNSVMHRRSCFDLVENWDDSPELWFNADAVFFLKLSQHWDFHPVNFVTDLKNNHEHNIQSKMIRGALPWINITEEAKKLDINKRCSPQDEYVEKMKSKFY